MTNCILRVSDPVRLYVVIFSFVALLALTPEPAFSGEDGYFLLRLRLVGDGNDDGG